jgi:O-antigen ligase
VAATANAASSRGRGRAGRPLEAHDRVVLGNVVVFLALLAASMLMGSSVRGVGLGLVLIGLLGYVGFRRWRRSP